MNTMTALLERNNGVDSQEIFKNPFLVERLFTLFDVGQGMRMTQWPLEPRVSFRSGTAEGLRNCPWE